MDLHEDAEDSLEKDYYALFNVSREANLEEITNAYRRLSKFYHPDKHIDPKKKKDAEALFSQINKVYKVLKDPEKRAIYDTVGIKGLESNDWNLVLRTKNPNSVLKAYERFQIEQEEKKQLQKANPRGTFGVNINATDLFNSYPTDYESNVFSSVEVSGMTFTQSIETPLTQKNVALLGGELSVKNGIGSGAIHLSLKRLMSGMAWIEGEISAGSWPALTLRGYRRLTRKMHFNGNIPIKFTSKGIEPSIAGSVSMEFEKHTIGQLTYKGGLHSSMSTSIIKSTENSHTIFTIEFSRLQSYISLQHEHMFLDRRLGMTGFIQLGNSSWALEYGVKNKMSSNTTISTVVSVDSIMGVSVRIKLKRAYQIYKFSIFLSEEVAPAPIFYGTIVPLMGWVLVKKFIVEPLQQQQRQQKKERRKKEEAELWLQRKKEAQKAVELMSVTCSKIKGEEEKKHGLVILNAVYGNFIYVDESSGTSAQRKEIIDVTVPLQCQVRDSKLILQKSTKSNLIGFYDPCVGEDKFLFVQYLFQKNAHQCMTKDNEPLSIPKASHRVSST